jgi:hypothetical protein
LKETIKRLSSIFEERREREQLAAAQALKLACAICKSAGFRSEEAVIPYPFEPLDFQFAVLVSSHLTQRGERDCTTFGAFYNVAS